MTTRKWGRTTCMKTDRRIWVLKQRQTNSRWQENEVRSSVGNSHRSASPRPTTLEEDRELFVNFSLILCLWFEIQDLRAYNFLTEFPTLVRRSSKPGRQGKQNKGAWQHGGQNTDDGAESIWQQHRLKRMVSHQQAIGRLSVKTLKCTYRQQLSI